MDTLNPEYPPVVITPASLPPRIWKFWGTALWGLFIFGGMFVGQAAVIAYFVLRQGGPIDIAGLGMRGGWWKCAFDDRHTQLTRVVLQTLNVPPAMNQAPATAATSVRNCCSYSRA